mgnify:CR=1 FL=1
MRALTRVGRVVFDCDSTLTAIEGIDELAAEHRAKIEVSRIPVVPVALDVDVEVLGRRPVDLERRDADRQHALAPPHQQDRRARPACLGQVDLPFELAPHAGRPGRQRVAEVAQLLRELRISLETGELEQLGIDAEYRRFRVQRDGFAAYLKERRQDSAWRGCNVTMPLKLDALALSDEASDRSSRTYAPWLRFCSGPHSGPW